MGLAEIVARVLNVSGTAAAFMRKRTIDPAWWRDAYAFDQAVRAVNAVLEALRPAGDVSPRRFEDDPQMEDILKGMGEGLAHQTLRHVVDPASGTAEQEEWGRRVRAKLGAMLEREAER